MSPLRKALGRARPRAVPVPPVPSGATLGPPDFVGVGAQRCGTTWWFRNLAAHPDIRDFPDDAHELHFFDDYWSGGFDASEASAYARYFPRRPGEVCGEWTPRYLYDPWVAPLLRRAAPEARILVLARDPIDRFLSGLAHAAAMGTRTGPSLVDEAFQRGLYGAQLRRLLRFFPREQVLVLQFERCVAEPRPQLARTLAFLGLDPGAGTPPIIERKVNRAYRPRPAVDKTTLDLLRDEYRRDAAELSSLFPELDLDLWPALR